jgi:hypothetical protein
MKFLFFVIWLFIITIIPQFIIFGIVFNTLFLLTIPVLITNYNLFFKDISIKVFLILFLFILFFHFIVSIYNQYFEFGIFRQILIFPVIFINYYYYIKKFQNYKPLDTLKYLFLFTLGVLLLNSITIILTVLSSSFSDILYKFVYLTEKQAGGISESRLIPRYSGFAVSGFSYLSFKYMFLYIISILFLLKSRLSSIQSIYVIFSSLVIIISLFFVARTGLLFVILFFFWFIANKYLKKIRIKELFFLIFFVIITYKFIVVFLEDKFGLALDRSFDYVFNYLENSEIDNGTIADLSKELIFPDSLFDWFFGTGDFGRDRELITDIGWLTFINGSGLLGVLIYYTPYYFLFLKAWYSKYRNIAFALILCSFITNAKDLVYLEHGYIQGFCILSILILWRKYHQLA